MEVSDQDDQIDDSLYSRQRYVLGDNAMKRMAHSHVLIVGFGGLGVEIAKNVTLAGVKSITVQDHRICQIADLSTQFFIREADVKAGKTRVGAGVGRLAELNPHVIVKSVEEPFGPRDGSWEFLQDYRCLIMSEVDFQTQVEVDNFCRSQNPPIAVISGDVAGLFTYGFCDFGDDFEVLDSNGEDPKEVFICNITNEEPAVVTVFDARPHGFESGDWVEFKEVTGMTDLNGQRRQVKVISPYQFTVTEISHYSKYQGGGIACELKLSKRMRFQSLNDQLKTPSLNMPDLSKFMAPTTIHACFIAYYKLKEELMSYGARSSFDSFMANVKEAAGNDVDLEEKLVRGFYLSCTGCFLPLCTVLGGLLAQEVIKALSGKFTPLNQWMHLDCCEVLHDKEILQRDHPYQLHGDRYDQLRLCVGEEVCRKLSELNIFMIGCGAIGCEMMKLYALLGIGTNGKLTVTDNDLIEKSNLNRQFLFRPHHVQKPKSVTAAEASMEMNPSLVIEAQLHKVHEGTETTIHTDRFFSEQDIIVNALDNVEARIYVDQRCVDTGKPLLESGTTGAKGHTQVVVPHMTESYGTQRDPTDEDVPFCSLKSFPAKLDHCIIWARNKFESSYNAKPSIFNKFWSDNGAIDSVRNRLANGDVPKDSWIVAKQLKCRPLTWKDCIHLARLKFEKYFSYKALSLLHAYPLDHLRDDGTSFWQLPRRPPHPIIFNMDVPHHLDFIKSAAFLFAQTSGINVCDDDMSDGSVKGFLADVVVPPFVPKSKKIVVDEEEAGPSPDVLDMDIDDVEIIMALDSVTAKSEPDRTKSLATMSCQEFEKDDDSNGHIDYIVATANLRAEMYGIAGADRYSIKRVAGKIIPAIATTTATVAGLVIMELFKLIRTDKLEDYRNSFLNLALPVIVLSEPGAAKRTTIREGLSFTLWDKISIQGNSAMTMREFMDQATSVIGSDVDMVLQGSKIIYSALIPTYKKKINDRMDVLIKRQGEKPFVDLTVCFSDIPEEMALSIPPVRYYF